MFLLLFFLIWPASLLCAATEYVVSFKLDPENSALQRQLEEVSYLETLQSHPPDTLEELRWRADRDKIHMERFLYGKGYMQAIVFYDLKGAESEKDPATVSVAINLGPKVTYNSIHIETSDAPQWFKESIIETESMCVGAVVDFDNIKSAQEKLEKEAKHRGHPWAICAKPILDIHTNELVADLVFPMSFGGRTKIGTTTIEGLTHVDATYVRNRLAWHEGQDFDQNIIDQSRETLVMTTLFTEVDIQINKRPGDASVVDIIVKLTEGPARTIGIGLRYATAEGIGGRVYWRHKNVWGKAHSLELGSRRTKLQTRTEAKWEVPDFGQPQQTLSNNIFTSIERQRAYRGRIYGGSVLLGRPLWSRWTGKVGVLVDRSRLRQDQSYYEARLAGLPAQLHFDGSNSLLDPSRGIRLEGWGTPFWGSLDKKRSTFINTRLHVSGYLPLSSAYQGSDPVIVLAGFGRMGKILGKSIANIPPHQRFYAGGADSIRAYGPQMLGQLDSNQVPLGGLFLTEYGGEVRLKTSEKIGLVAFAEAGSLTSYGVTDVINHLKAKPLWGVGTGARYYTPLGPVRVDIAFPLKRRKDSGGRAIDSFYQFYISFGQAF